MPSESDPYKVFGIPRDATPDQIRRKYRKLLKKFHPDIVAPDGDPEMIEYANRMTAEINAASEILNDPNRRAQYDGAHQPPQLQVYDVMSDVEIGEGEEAIIRFKVDNSGGEIPPGKTLRFRSLAEWLRFELRKVESLRQDREFPMQVELLVDTEGLAAGVFHEGDIEFFIGEE